MPNLDLMTISWIIVGMFAAVAILGVLWIVIFGVLWNTQAPDTDTEASERPSRSKPIENGKKLVHGALPKALPREVPYREILRKGGVETEKDLRELESLEGVFNIGPSRASAIWRWYEESDRRDGLPDELMPEREERRREKERTVASG